MHFVGTYGGTTRQMLGTDTVMPLTDTALRRLKTEAKPYKLADGGGLYLFVKPNGTKSWRIDYRFLGKRKTLSIGAYPAVTLADARTRREASKALLAQGKDPSVQKRAEKRAAIVANANTFGAIAEEYLLKIERDGRSQATLNKNKWMMVDLTAPLAGRPISEISSADVLEVLRTIERSGRVETALATRAAIGRVFRFAIATARAENDPTFALRGALQRHLPTSYPAVTTKAELGGLMRAIYGYQGWASLSAALKIQAICFARPGETRTMSWQEVNLEEARWTIPANKTKMRRDHEVPLSRQAVAVISQMKELSGTGAYVFPSMMSGKKLLSENSMNSALRRMGFTHEEHTAHGFRSTASTILNESGLFSPDVIELQLAHQDSNAVRRIYNRAVHWEERARMMQWWADLLDSVRDSENEPTDISG